MNHIIFGKLQNCTENVHLYRVLKSRRLLHTKCSDNLIYSGLEENSLCNLHVSPRVIYFVTRLLLFTFSCEYSSSNSFVFESRISAPSWIWVTWISAILDWSHVIQRHPRFESRESAPSWIWVTWFSAILDLSHVNQRHPGFESCESAPSWIWVTWISAVLDLRLVNQLHLGFESRESAPSWIWVTWISAILDLSHLNKRHLGFESR
jgi:hypothetical protein